MKARKQVFLTLGLLLGVLGFPAARAFDQPRGTVAAANSLKIAGTIVNAVGGQPLGGAEVTIYVAGTNQLAQRFVTDSDGRFIFGNVKPGKYLLMATKGGYPQQPYQGHGQYSTAVAAGPGLISEGLIFPMHAGASIKGTLVDDQNEPIRDAEVRLFRSEPETGVPLTAFVENATPDDRGQYRFSQLPPGRYFVAVSAKPWYAAAQGSLSIGTGPRSPLDMAYPVTYFGGSTEASAATPIVLKDGDHATADIALFPVPAIRLRVRTLGDSGNLQLRQQVFSTLVDPLIEMSKVKGAFDLHGLAPGRYQIFQTGLGLQDGFERVLDLTSDLEIDGAGSPIQSQVRGVVTVRGGSERVPGRTAIRLSNLQSGLALDARISRKNDFQFEGNLAPGVYSVSFVGAPRVVVGSVVATGATVTGHTVEIHENSPVQLAVALERGIQIDGIAQRNGKPASAAMILLAPSDPAHNLVLFRRDQSDSDGTFSLYNVPPGTYTLLALENAWDLEWASPTALARYLKAGKVVQVAAGGGGAKVTVETQ